MGFVTILCAGFEFLDCMYRASVRGIRTGVSIVSGLGSRGAAGAQGFLIFGVG